MNLDGVGYAISDPTNGGSGKYIWHMSTFDSGNGGLSDVQKNIYCLKGGYGESWQGFYNESPILEYNLVFDLQKDRETLLSKLIDNKNDGDETVQALLNKNGTQYREILWILDNLYIKGEIDKEEFLYRIGNKNNVPLNHFFQNDKPEETFTLSITDVIKAGPIGANPDFGVTIYIDNTIKESNNGTWALNKSNWQKVNLKFKGTGVVKIKIGEVSVNFEVVDGNNVFQYSGLKSNESNVLLNDIKMASGGRLYLNGDTLYGNDFEFDVTAGNSKGDSISDNCRISLQDSTLDNVRIIGDPFDGFSATRYGSLNICNVYSTGESRIVNCFISYCAAPVRIKDGNLEKVNTTSP